MFYCYSIKLRNFLMKSGLRYVSKDVHKKTNKTFWCFIGDEKLNNLIEEFRLKKVK